MRSAGLKWVRGWILVTMVVVMTVPWGIATEQAAGQLVIPAELEGPITGLVLDGVGSGGVTNPPPSGDWLLVMGVEVLVPPGTPIHTPVADLTVTDLLGRPFPGRIEEGFLGGTAIVLAETVAGLTVALDIFVEPQENVLIGAVTANDAGVISILGLPVHLITDWRMQGEARTESGFLVDLTTVQIGTFAVAEGYYAADGLFHAFAIEASGQILGAPNQTSITRAICDLSGRLKVRGASTTPTGTISIFDDVSGKLLGTTVIKPDEDNPPGGIFRFEVPSNGVCPSWVRAENSNGSMAIAEVEVID